MTKKIKKAKVAVIYDFPFFATLLLKKNFQEDPSVTDMVTDGVTIRYNNDWVEKAPFEDIKATMCKAAMHDALLHPSRRGGRDLEQWREACDYAVADILEKNGIKLPPKLLRPEYSGLAAEKIYTQLGKKKKADQKKPGSQPGPQGNGKQPGQSPNGFGTVADTPKGVDIKELQAKAKQDLAGALFAAKRAGKSPACEDIIYDIINPKVPWQEVLARHLTEAARNDYSFSKPNVRYLQSGFILPSLYNLEVGEIVEAIDVSISMDKDAINEVTSETADIAATFNAHMTIIPCNTKVLNVQYIEPGDDFELQLKGKGGTDFRPPFAWLEEQGIVPKCLIYLTDGECDDFPEEPDYPVLWCITGGKKFEPPFGEVVYIE
jgi:predicted metal-dependent peptidase